jgi:hypothetical protein
MAVKAEHPFTVAARYGRTFRGCPQPACATPDRTTTSAANVHLVADFAAACRSRCDLSGANSCKGICEIGKCRRRRDGDIVRAQHCLHLRRNRSKALYGSAISIEVRFCAVQPDAARIVSVTCDEQSVLAIEEANGIRRMPRCRDDLERSPAEVDPVTVMPERREFPCPSGISPRIETLRHVATNLIGRHCGLHVFPRSTRADTRKVCIHAINGFELAVASHVIVMGM